MALDKDFIVKNGLQILNGDLDLNGGNLNNATITSLSATFASGSAAAPSITFTGDPDTGWYNSGINALGAAANGSLQFLITEDRIQVPAGTVSLPGISFLTDSNSGFYSSNTDQVALSLGGSLHTA